MQRGLLFHRRDILGLTAVQVFLREALGRGQRDRARDCQLVAEFKCALEPGRVEPQPGIVHPFFGGEAGDDVLGIRPARDDLRADKRGRLDVMQPGLGERLD